MLTLGPPISVFLLFRRGVPSSPDARGWLLRTCECLWRGCYEKPGPRKSVEFLRREIRSGPGSNRMGVLTLMFPRVGWHPHRLPA
jgi:hypothetical protein